MCAPRILIVEDESVVALDIQERLQGLGYVVPAVADSADEAVRLALELAPDLVLMDIRLRGDKDGISAAREIAARAGPPVIYLTAYADDPTLARARDSAAFGYLSKPFRERELRATIEMALAKADAERRLRASERRYAATVNSIGDGIVGVDGDGRVNLLNPVAERLTGWRQADAAGRPVEQVVVLVNERTRQPVENPVTRALRDRTVVTLPPETALLSRAGRQVPVEDTAAPISDERGAVLAFRDVTERKEAEARLRHAQKLESLGVLAGGIAHDFNNLLTPILGYAGFARDMLPPDSLAATFLSHIEQAARRAAELSQQMLTYSGRGAFAPQPVDLAALVAEMAALLAVSISKKAALRRQLAAGLPPVQGDAGQLRQVVMNLLINASEALQDQAGTIELRTRLARADGEAPRSPLGRESLPEGDYVVLEVSDSGCGMTPEVQARVFDPFFTTKFQGRGLGLATVLGIVRSHGGTIRLDSVPGRGTTFEVWLPCAARPAAARPEKSPAERWRGSGTVLLAEDDAAVRGLARAILEGSGFTVLAAANGQEAVELFRERGGAVVLALLDLKMPRLNGLEALARLRQLRPGLPAVLMSGYSEEEVAQQAAEQGGASVVQKPFSPAELVAILRQVLEAAP
jgi:PAS domain S-box-containing protein